MSTAFQPTAFQSDAWQILAGASGAVVVVPDVVGQLEADGTLVLTTALFAVVVEYAKSSSVRAGVIISQNPVGGSSALQGATVTILVSLGDSGGGTSKKKHKFALHIHGQRVLGTKEDFQALLPKISIPVEEIKVMALTPSIRLPETDDFEKQAKMLESELKLALQAIRDQEDEDILKYL